jgi:phage tail-like protein
METEQLDQLSLSQYRYHLPAYLQTDALVGRLLLAFERVLTGLPNEATTPFYPQVITAEPEPTWGLETLISQVHTYLDPQQTPGEFLPWLAGWVALGLRNDWDEKVKRNFISQIVPLYQMRGTVAGLKKMLQIYLENSGLSYPERTISVFEFEDRPHYFQVQLTLPSHQVIQPERYWRECRATQAIIDQEKPAHTFYALRILTLTMQLTRAWGCCYPFTLFDHPPQQLVEIEARVQLDDPSQSAWPPGVPLDQQILIRIQGKTAVLEPPGSQLGPVVRQTVFYEQLLTNPQGFFIALANLGDRPLSGTLTVQLNFNLNHQSYSPVVFEAPFSLDPNLRIYRPWRQLQSMVGNTRLAADPERTLRLQEDPPLRIYQDSVMPIDGNTRLGDRVGRTLRLVQDARLRIYWPRPRYDRMVGNTRLGAEPGQGLQLPRDRQAPTLRIYQFQQEYRVGNTRLGSEIGHTLRLVPNSQWLEQPYRFQLFEQPAKRNMAITALIEPQARTPEDLQRIFGLLTVRMQSRTAAYPPFLPDLDYLPTAIRAVHRLTYDQFLANPQGFYVVLTNVDDRPVTGKVTVKLSFILNQRPLELVLFEEDFHLSPRDNGLQICYPNQYGDIEGNTILGRLTPYNLTHFSPPEEAWVD